MPEPCQVRPVGTVSRAWKVSTLRNMRMLRLAGMRSLQALDVIQRRLPCITISQFTSTRLELPESLHAHLPGRKIRRNVSLVRQNQAEARCGEVLHQTRRFRLRAGVYGAL